MADKRRWFIAALRAACDEALKDMMVACYLADRSLGISQLKGLR